MLVARRLVLIARGLVHHYFNSTALKRAAALRTVLAQIHVGLCQNNTSLFNRLPSVVARGTLGVTLSLASDSYFLSWSRTAHPPLAVPGRPVPGPGARQDRARAHPAWRPSCSSVTFWGSPSPAASAMAPAAGLAVPPPVRRPLCPPRRGGGGPVLGGNEMK